MEHWQKARRLGCILAASARRSVHVLRPPQAWLDALYPRRCEVCGAEPGSAPGYLCWDCRASFQPVALPFCSRCGDPVAGRIDHAYECHFCTQHQPQFERARSALRFDGVARELVHAFKYRKALWLAGDFALLMQGCLDAWFDSAGVDLVCPVPMHPLKRLLRGYNQAEVLADELAARIGKPFSARVLRRLRYTRTQTRLTAGGRISNVRGSFGVRRRLEGVRTVLLVDDVMTTGATAAACASALKDAGAERIWALTLARG